MFRGSIVSTIHTGKMQVMEKESQHGDMYLSSISTKKIQKVQLVRLYMAHQIRMGLACPTGKSLGTSWNLYPRLATFATTFSQWTSWQKSGPEQIPSGATTRSGDVAWVDGKCDLAAPQWSFGDIWRYLESDESKGCPSSKGTIMIHYAPLPLLMISDLSIIECHWNSLDII